MTDTLGPGQPIHYPNTLEGFYAAAKRLEELTKLEGWGGAIQRARAMPEAEKRIAERVRIEGRDDEPATKDAAAAIRTALMAEYEARGHQKRRAALDEIAHEIDTLRAKLPQLAVDAVYQMGEIARQVRDEASK